VRTIAQSGQQVGCDGPPTLNSCSHLTSPLLLSYDAGVLTVTCGYCLGVVAQFAVASLLDALH
jgi:hypothetical protein